MSKHIWITIVVGVILGVTGYVSADPEAEPAAKPEFQPAILEPGQQPTKPKVTPKILLIGYLNDSMAGWASPAYFCEPLLAENFYTLRSWAIIKESSLSEGVGFYTVRIESSNKGGMPIIKDWTFFINKSERDTNKYCIVSIQ